MKRLRFLSILVLIVSISAITTVVGFGGNGSGGGAGSGDGSGGGKTETVGNNLSYPVIWSEGIEKVAPGTPGMAPLLTGDYWYQWGTNGADPNVVPASCPHDPDETNSTLNPNGDPFCNDNIPGALTKPAGVPAAQTPLPLARAYLQKDAKNQWRAWSGTATEAGVANLSGGVDIDWIDWGDNLESVDWYTRSQVRTEVVLFKDILDPLPPLLEYEMRHTSGWGIDEVHGLAADFTPAAYMGPGTRATVYSPCARLTIQKLLVTRDNPLLADLVWALGAGWIEPEGYATNLINPPIFNKAVYEAGDGPDYYSAEVNVKGRIIYGYTWNVRKLNDMTPIAGSTAPTAAGDYRITYSFDEQCGSVGLSTFFVEGTTNILLPLEEEETAVAAEEGDDTAGATAVLQPAVFENGELIGGNLTYMDVHILDRGGGKGGRTSLLNGQCVCECVGEQCTCECKELCNCDCTCQGEECTCTCAEACGCDCACADGNCDCSCGATECTEFQAQVQSMVQHHEQWQGQCPGPNCPCTDHQGNTCHQHRAQLNNMIQSMQQLQFSTCCGEEGCHCLCQNGDACQQIRTQLTTMAQEMAQVSASCASGDCEADADFFSSLSLSLTNLAERLEVMESEFLFYLPTLEKE